MRGGAAGYSANTASPTAPDRNSASRNTRKRARSTRHSTTSVPTTTGLAKAIARSLGWLPENSSLVHAPTAEQRTLAEAVRRKNELFFYRWRAVNGEYIYGRRKEPFGVVNFPAEMAALARCLLSGPRSYYLCGEGEQLR